MRNGGRFRDANGIPLPAFDDSVNHRPAAESFSAIASNLGLNGTRLEKQVLMVTSALAGEGKTTTALNIGATFARRHLKTLFVEANIRRPAVAKALALEEGPGLAEILALDLTPQRAVQKSGMKELAVITAGQLQADPLDLLSSSSLEKFLTWAREKFVIVIFDMPDVNVHVDACLLASKVDAIVLVARAHVTSRPAIKEAKMRLEAEGGNLVGVVLNRYRRAGRKLDRTGGRRILRRDRS